jgi:hypothetical protein
MNCTHTYMLSAWRKHFLACKQSFVFHPCPGAIWFTWCTDIVGHVWWNSKRRLPLIVCRPRKTNVRFPFPFAANKREFAVSIFRLRKSRNVEPWTWRHGAKETRRQGDKVTRRQGDMDSWRHRSTEARRPGSMETRRCGDVETWRHGYLETWRHERNGDMEIWRHV